jgi:hypothetical protein
MNEEWNVNFEKTEEKDQRQKDGIIKGKKVVNGRG